MDLWYRRVDGSGPWWSPFVGLASRGLTEIPVTRAEVSYQRPCRFAERIDVICWLAWARYASLGFAYRLEVRGELAACAYTDHALVDVQGRPRRFPESMQQHFARWLGRPVQGT